MPTRDTFFHSITSAEKTDSPSSHHFSHNSGSRFISCCSYVSFQDPFQPLIKHGRNILLTILKICLHPRRPKAIESPSKMLLFQIWRSYSYKLDSETHWIAPRQSRQEGECRLQSVTILAACILSIASTLTIAKPMCR